MSCKHILPLVVVVMTWAMPSAGQSVKVEFSNGLVSVSAQNAPVRQILAEWARVGGTTFVNADRLAGGPVTLQLENVTERQAVDVLLRGVSGYMVAAREVPGAGASSIDRILIVPTSSAPRPASPGFTPPPVAAQPMPQPQIDIEPDEDEQFPPPNPNAPQDAEDRPANPRVRPPLVPPNVAGRPMPPQPFQPDPADDSDEQPTPTPAPSNPFGVAPGSARPGVITPVPQQPRERVPQPDPEP